MSEVEGADIPDQDKWEEILELRTENEKLLGTCALAMGEIEDLEEDIKKLKEFAETQDAVIRMLRRELA